MALNISRGGASAKEEAAKTSFSSFKRVEFLNIKDGESIIVRFIDDGDEWPWVYQHGFVPTKGAPPDWDPKGKDGAPAKQWSETMGSVCRKQKNKDGDLVFPDYNGECFICDEMHNPDNKKGKYFPSVKVWARVIEREQVKGTQQMVDDGLIPARKLGKPVGFRDKLIEQQDTDSEGNPTGPVKKVPRVFVINQGMKNFYGGMEAFYENYGTVLDRDFRITREGEKLKTDYNIIPLEPIKIMVPVLDNEGNPEIDLETGEPEMEEGVWSLEDPAIKESYAKLLNMEAEIERQASDRHYDTFFDNRPGHEHPTSKKDDAKPAKAKRAAEDDDEGVGTAAPAEPEDDEQDVAALRQRLAEKAGILSSAASES